MSTYNDFSSIIKIIDESDNIVKTLDTENIQINDNIIEINSDKTSGIPSENMGIIARRGASTSASFLWDESTDTWKAGLEGSEKTIALLSNSISSTLISYDSLSKELVGNTGLTYSSNILSVANITLSDTLRLQKDKSLILNSNMSNAELDLSNEINSSIIVKRGAYGNDAQIRWNELYNSFELGLSNNMKLPCVSNATNNSGGAIPFFQAAGTILYTDTSLNYINQNLGIGTTLASAKCHIIQTGDSDCFRVDDQASDVTRFLIDQSGKVAIQKSTASQALDVAGNTLISGSCGIGTSVIPSTARLEVVGDAVVDGVVQTAIPIAEYPSIALTGNVSTLNTASYANGQYICTNSSNNSASRQAWNCFDKNHTTFWASADLTYNSGSEDYSGSVTTTYNGSLTLLGEWLQVQLPVSIVLSYYTMQAINNNSPLSPTTFGMFGSNDGTTWILLGNIISGETQFTNSQIRTYTINAASAYSFYRFVINKRATSTNRAANIGELRLYGAQSTPPSFIANIERVGVNTISPNINTALDIVSTNRCIRIPTLTNSALSSLGNTTGFVAYNTDISSISFNDGTAWRNLNDRNTNLMSCLHYATPKSVSLPASGIRRIDLGSGQALNVVGSSNWTASGQFTSFQYTGSTTTNLVRMTISFYHQSQDNGQTINVSLFRNGTFSGTSYSSGGIELSQSITQIPSNIGYVLCTLPIVIAGVTNNDIFHLCFSLALGTADRLFFIQNIKIVAEVSI